VKASQALALDLLFLFANHFQRAFLNLYLIDIFNHVFTFSSNEATKQVKFTPTM